MMEEIENMARAFVQETCKCECSHEMDISYKGNILHMEYSNDGIDRYVYVVCEYDGENFGINIDRTQVSLKPSAFEGICTGLARLKREIPKTHWH